jgi:hypothetical protein
MSRHLAAYSGVRQLKVDAPAFFWVLRARLGSWEKQSSGASPIILGWVKNKNLRF